MRNEKEIEMELKNEKNEKEIKEKELEMEVGNKKRKGD